MKLSENQDYYDNRPSVAKIGAAVEKRGRACSRQRSDIVLNAIGNLLVFEIAQRFETNQHQEISNLLARKITEGLQRYLGNKKMFATSGELTDLYEIDKNT